MINDLSYNKAAEYLIALCRQVQQHIAVFRFHERIDGFLALPGEGLLAEQYIDRYDNTDERIDDLTDDTDDPYRQIGHDVIRPRQKVRSQPCLQHVCPFLHCGLDERPCRRVLKLYIVKLVNELIELARQCEYKITYTGI